MTATPELEAIVAALLHDKCTGADLVDAVRSLARIRDVPAHALARKLSPHPGTWLKQVAIAQRPKPHTIARVRALMLGERVPEPPKAAAKRPPPTQSRARNMVRVTRAGAMLALPPSPAAPPDDRASTLRAEIFAETADHAVRRWVAQSSGTVVSTLDVRRDQPVRAIAPDDRRPMATSREPCRRCAARGDLGCEHQRPFEPIGAAA